MNAPAFPARPRGRRHTVMLAGLVLIGMIAVAGQGRTFLGTVTSVAKTSLSVRGDGRDVVFLVTDNTVFTPRAAANGDEVRVTFTEADVPVALRVEVISAASR